VSIIYHNPKQISATFWRIFSSNKSAPASVQAKQEQVGGVLISFLPSIRGLKLRKNIYCTARGPSPAALAAFFENLCTDPLNSTIKPRSFWKMHLWKQTLLTQYITLYGAQKKILSALCKCAKALINMAPP
jgi:hypothetical protein